MPCSLLVFMVWPRTPAMLPVLFKALVFRSTCLKVKNFRFRLFCRRARIFLLIPAPEKCSSQNNSFLFENNAISYMRLCMRPSL